MDTRTVIRITTVVAITRVLQTIRHETATTIAQTETAIIAVVVGIQEGVAEAAALAVAEAVEAIPEVAELAEDTDN